MQRESLSNRPDRPTAKWCWVLAFAVVVALATCIRVAGAAQPGVDLEITPTVIQLAPGENADIIVIVRNSTPSLILDLELSCSTEVNVTIRSESPQAPQPFLCTSQSGSVPVPASLHVDRLQSDGSLAWLFHVAKTASGSANGKILFRLDYRAYAAGASEAVSGVVIGMLEIQERLELVDSIAEVRVETAADQLQEKRPGILYIVVRNLSAVPVTITHIVPTPPSFVAIDPPAYGPTILDAQASLPFTFTATVAGAVRPGKHLLLFDIGVEWARSGYTQAGNLIATHKLEANVLGESDILKLVGVPSFLLLPGFLMVTTFMTLWTHVKPHKALNLKENLPEFALLSITLSLLAAPLYPVITTWFGSPRDYLESYGLLDVILVWTGSIGGGGVIWALWLVGVNVAQRIQTQRNIPLETDSPVTVLRKMERHHIPYPPEYAEAQGPQGKSICFIILRAPGDGNDIWVAPAIVYDVKPPARKAPAGETSPGDKLDTDINEASQNHSPAVMARVLEQGIETGICTVTWDQEVIIQRPEKLDRDKVKPKKAALVQFVRPA